MGKRSVEFKLKARGFIQANISTLISTLHIPLQGDKLQPSTNIQASKKDETSMDETLEQNDDDQEKDDEDDTKNNDDTVMNAESIANSVASDTSSAEDDASMTDDDPTKPIIKVDEPEAKKLKGDESLEGDDGMKTEKVASFTNNLEQSRNDLENDASSDVATSALDEEEKVAPLENSKSCTHCYTVSEVASSL